MKDYNSKKKTKIMKYFIPLILLFFTSCATIVRQVLPLENLPLPTGQYNVGTKIYTWEDSSRKEWFGEKSNKNEELYFPEFRILKSQEKREIKCSFLPSVRWGTLVGAKKQNPQISGQSGSKFCKMSIF